MFGVGEQGGEREGILLRIFVCVDPEADGKKNTLPVKAWMLRQDDPAFSMLGHIGTIILNITISLRDDSIRCYKLTFFVLSSACVFRH